jgi:hypothetical protein
MITLTDVLEFRSVQVVPPRAKSKHYGKQFPLVDGIVALGSIQMVREEGRKLALQVLIFLLQTSPTAVVRCISDDIERFAEVRRMDERCWSHCGFQKLKSRGVLAEECYSPQRQATRCT